MQLSVVRVLYASFEDGVSQRVGYVVCCLPSLSLSLMLLMPFFFVDDVDDVDDGGDVVDTVRCRCRRSPVVLKAN